MNYWNKVDNVLLGFIIAGFLAGIAWFLLEAI